MEVSCHETSIKMKSDSNIKKRMFGRRFILEGIALCLLIISVLIFLGHESKADPASEAVIRREVGEWLNKDPNELTDQDFAKLTEFEFTMAIMTKSKPGGGWRIETIKRELSDIKLLEKFTNLQKLKLDNFHFQAGSISLWTKILAQLGLFDSRERPALDLSPLEKLIHLQELDLVGPSIRNIKPLASLINLTYLHLNDTSVSDIEPIKEMINLERLEFTELEVSDLEPIKGLTKLKILYIRKCKNITDEELEDLQETLPNLDIYIYK